MSKIEVSKRRAIFAELKGYCHLSSDNDYMEVTEWSNGEGYDVCIDRKSGSEKFSLTHGEWVLMQVLMNWKGEQ
jgi:hypothetical protein